MTQDDMKKRAAEAALEYIEPGSILGVGTGSTISVFIDLLASSKRKPDGVVASSVKTAQQLKKTAIPLVELSAVNDLPLYIDSADEIDRHLQLIKGGGGALTREKILASASRSFICIADQTKLVNLLGQCSLPIEVIPMACSYVAREIVKLGGFPVYREKYITDNGNFILDVKHLPMTDPVKLEQTLNNIPGVVENGLFARRVPNIVLLATPTEVQVING